MDIHVKEFYCQFSDKQSNGNFHKVIVLHEDPSVMSWSKVVKMIPHMSKGWFELTKLSVKDRIEFTRDFWISQLPFHIKLSEAITQFFDSLDDVAIIVTQKMFDSPFEAHMIYSLKNNNGFFRGELPITENQLEMLKKSFEKVIFPEDYIAFLRIHNGFSKSTDTGLLPSTQIPQVYVKLQEYLDSQGTLLSPEGAVVEPGSLIPYYESFGLPCFHCFWADWYPQQEMGNIYYSGLTNTISACKSSESSPENLAFPTFADWLMFYLERIT